MQNFFKKGGQLTKKLSKDTSKYSKQASSHMRKFLLERLDNAHKVRNQIVGWIILMAVLIFFVGLQFLWYQQTYKEETFTAGGTYTEATLGKINTLNPIYAATGSELAAAKLLFSSLYSYDVSGRLKGDLAESITMSEDGISYAVDLRQDAFWHDGKPVTADDVVFTVETIKNPDTRAILYNSWRSVTVAKLGDYKVGFQLPVAYAAFKDSLTFPVLPAHILSNVSAGQIHESSFSLSPVGSGPFVFGSLELSTEEADNIVHLAFNENYYGGAPKLNRFLINAYDKKEDIISGINSNFVNGTADLSVNDKDVLPKDMIIREAAINNGVFAFLNTTSPVLGDVLVRRAVQAGVDVQKMREHDGGAQPLDLPILSSQMELDVDTAVLEHDIEKAKSLLGEAGYTYDENNKLVKDGKRSFINIVTVQGDYYPEIARNMEEQLVGLGFDVRVDIYDVTNGNLEFLQNVIRPRSYDILIYEIEMGADADSFVYYHSSQIGQTGLNLSNYRDDISDDLLLSGRSTIDAALRKVKYESFVKKWLNDVPAIGIYQANMTYYYQRNVKAFAESNKLVQPVDRFSDVLYWAASKRVVYRTP